MPRFLDLSECNKEVLLHSSCAPANLIVRSLAIAVVEVFAKETI
jgi:hypothetical protein